MRIKKIYTLPAPSTSFTREAFISTQGGQFAIRFGYLKDGQEYLSGISFSNVAAVRAYAERCCKLQIIESSYDVLVEMGNSQWVAELRRGMEPLWRDKWRTRHFMIYIDSSGGFEVVADDWQAMPDEPIY